MNTRWLVERKPDVFDEVDGSLSVLDCGALKFYTGSIFEPKDILILAPGQWITVCEAAS